MRQAHVVILTAIALEYRAAKQVDAGAWEGSRWEEEPGPNGLPVAFRTFRGKGGKPLRVAVAQAGGMAGVATVNALLPLVEKYQPRCVAMCGVCAGRPGKTQLGDVIAPDRLFFHDTGKREPGEVKQDIQTYNLRDDWKVAIEHLDFTARFQNEEWWKKRPTPYEWQENWVLAMLHQGVADPSSHPECEERCPQWAQVIASLWNAGHVQHGTLTLTEEGRKRIGPVLIQHRNRFPDVTPAGTLFPFKVHVAPMGSGNQVVEDEKVWDFVSESMRKTLGLEMEAAAIGAVAHAQRDKKLEAVVMKGVMDFANYGRDDHFKEFAARASAECLLAFLRKHFDVEGTRGIDDLLISGTERLPEKPPPSALLNARYQVVQFHDQGREQILAGLDRWCDTGPAVAVRLLHAEGGAGKTRLAIEWIRRRKEMNWAAGFLSKEAQGDWFDRLWGLGQPVLAVLDYAESRLELLSLPVLRRMYECAQPERAGAHPQLRVLLLARNDRDWWRALPGDDLLMGGWLGAAPPVYLEPLAEGELDREKVFHEAADWFAKALGRKYEQQKTVPLADKHFSRVLYVHMAALATVEGLEFKAHTLMETLLTHEENFWRLATPDPRRSPALKVSLARQVVATATLRGGLADASEASSITGRLLGRPPGAEEEEQLRQLQQIYQRAGEGVASFIPALEPDLLGEGMLLRVASPPLEADRVPPDWIDKVFPADAGTEVLSRGFEVLGRAYDAQPDLMRPWIRRLLEGPLPLRATAALKAAKGAGEYTAHSVLGDALAEQLEARGDVQLAHELEAMGIPYPTVSLRRVALWVSCMLVQELDAASKPHSTGLLRGVANWIGGTFLGRWGSSEVGALAERARRQFNLGIRLSEVGRREEALRAAQEAVELRRALSQRQPDAFQPDLVASLNDLGVRLNAVGRREEALKATQEAVEVYRILSQSNPDAFQPGLAGGLNNLGVRLSRVGRIEDALEAAQEAVEVYRALLQRNPEAFQHYLAMSLDNLGNRLSEVGRREEALKVTQEAVELRRALSQRQPDAFQPSLADSLNNLGVRLSGVERREEALEATQEAVEVYRALSQRQPDAFQPYLATSLNNLGLWLSEVGRREEALKATQEAVELRRALSQRQPHAFQPDLARSLKRLGDTLSELGRREEALAFYEEALGMIWPFFKRLPPAFMQTTELMLTSLLQIHEALQRPPPPILVERIEEFIRLTGLNRQSG